MAAFVSFIDSNNFYSPYSKELLFQKAGFDDMTHAH